MMIEDSSNKGYESKQEGEYGTMKTEKFSNKAAAAATTSRQWTSLRNPRIVRVSRSLGGKDRHSKVCTIRGLRDRRIRLSVPTAIQLYDLQDRLGLNQPSKVVDWLIEATQSDIDKLPPLDFTQQQTLLQQQGSFSLGGGYYDNQNLIEKSSRYNWDATRLKGKEAENVSNSSFGNLPYNNNSSNYYHLDPSSLSLSQFGSNFQQNNGSGMQFSSSSSSNLNVPAQLLFCPSSSAMSSLFSSTPQHAQFMSNNNSSMESDHIPRQSNHNVHHQIFNSSSSFIPTLHLPINSPFRRHPMPFISSKVLDSDHNNTRNNE